MFYRIDGQHRILEVGADWDEFAVSNGGAAGATRAAVVGRSLLDFVAGDAAKMFVRAAIDAAWHLGEERRVPYRCDSPTRRRRFEMVIKPQPGGHTLVEHVLVAEEPRPERPFRLRPATAGWRCSQCLALREPGQAGWVDADQAPPGVLAVDLCPQCAALLPAINAQAQGAEHGGR